MKRLCRLLVCFFVAAAPAAHGELRSTYLAPGEIDLQRVLPPPPEAGSAEAKADLAAVETSVKARTTADEGRINAQHPCTAAAFAGDILGDGFTPERVPLTTRLVEHAFEDAELAVLAAKAAIGRPRPYTLEPNLATYGHRSGSTSYPSGHATCGRVIAVILAAMVPAKARALYARADLYGRNRQMAGTHFPSDLAAGATAGAVIADALFRNERFKADFARASAEMHAALKAADRR